MIEAIFDELSELVNHTAVYVILLFCLIGLVFIFKNDVRKKCSLVIKINLAIFLFAVMISLLAEYLLDRWVSLFSTNDVHVDLYRSYRLCDSISVYARFFSGIIIFCGSLWTIAMNLLSKHRKFKMAARARKLRSNQSS
mgnify:CR=1 FL=1